MTYDLVVRNGWVIDGSNAPRRRADVAVVNGRIAEIGDVDDSGAVEVDAEGHVVAPGFVDGHTHMDAQVFWDELGTSSVWHGVTTSVMGNCGFTLAPARPDERALVVRNLERAEDIAAEAMAEGIDWTWSTFAEYLSAVDATPKGINYAGLIGHSALRTWAMGERAFTEPATEDDLQVMERELEDALRAGAVGFSTSRSQNHLTADDRPVASRQASWAEVTRLVEVLGRARTGAFQLAGENHHGDPDGIADYRARLRDLAVSSGVPVVYGLISGEGTELVDETVARGGTMFGLTHCRGVSQVQSFQTYIFFDRVPAWQELRSKPLAEQRRVLADPRARAHLVDAARHGDDVHMLGSDRAKPNFDRMQVMLSPYLPNPTVGQIARERRMDPADLVIELALERDLDLFFMQFFSDQDDAKLIEAMRNPNTAMTFSDSGAHVTQVIDSSIQSHLLAYWVRERQALTLEEAVHMITAKPAAVWRLTDRGLLREGSAADITIFDPDTVAPHLPRLVRDLPGGAPRLVQTAQGFKAVIVNGDVLTLDGEPTDARAGQLLRSDCRDAGR